MQVQEVMTKKIIKIKKGTTLREAAKILIKNDITGAPIVNEKDKVIGIISEKNVFRALYPNYEEFYIDLDIIAKPKNLDDRLLKIVDLKVENFMVKDVVSALPSDSVVKVGGIMMARGIHRVLVVDQKNTLLGVVSRRDIYPAVFKMLLNIK
ncbi:MAG: CBS domain-containing protein [Patescibacteria group bacterium]|nr:CBS domain-containing protein [Patescibacteria group bacterium]